MKKIYLFLTAMVLVLTACEKDQIGRYDLGLYVYFTQKETVLQSFSFSYYPGLTTHSLEFEVNLMGDLLTEVKLLNIYDTERQLLLRRCMNWIFIQFFIRELLLTR